MRDIEKSRHDYRVATMSGRTFLIYDGEGKSLQGPAEEKTIPEELSFTDKVMDEIGTSLQLTVIEGKLTDDMPRGPKARIEYVGPKKLPRITISPEQVRNPVKNILSFFKKK